MVIPCSFTYGVATGSALNVFPRPFDVYGTNDLAKRQVWAFKDTATLDELGFRTGVMPNMSGVTVIQFRVRFMCTVATGNYHWQLRYRSPAIAATGDPSTWEETVQPAAAAVPGTALNYAQQAFDVTEANFVEGDVVFGHLGRRGNGSDTAAGLLLVEELWLDLS